MIFQRAKAPLKKTSSFSDIHLIPIQRSQSIHKDFGNALKPFYGEKIASRFSELLKAHLVIAADLLKASKAEAVALLTKNYSAGIAIYDEIEKQALEMADMMSEGIIKQFAFK